MGSCFSRIVCGVAAPVLLPRLSRPATWLCSARPPCRVRHGWCTDAPSTTSPWSSARRMDAKPWSARDWASGAAGEDRRSHHRGSGASEAAGMNASSAAALRSEQSRACAFIHASAVLILLSARRARGTDTDAARAVPILFLRFRLCVCAVCGCDVCSP